GLASHRLSQCRIELELLGGLLRAQVPHLEPLLRKIVQKAARPVVCEHPADLLHEDLRVAQLPPLGNLEELVVWNALPQEEGQARGQFEIAQSMDRGARSRILLNPQHELRRREQRFERALDASIE